MERSTNDAARNGHDPERLSIPRPEPAPPAAAVPRSSDQHRRARHLAGILLCAIDAVVLVAGIVTVSLLDASPGWAGLIFAIVIALPLTLAGEPAPSRLTLSALDEVPTILSWVGVSLLVVAPVALATDSEGAVLLQGALSAVGLCVGRGASYGLIRRARRQGMLFDRAVVLGAGEVGTEVGRVLGQHPEFGIRVVGFIDSPSHNGGPPLLGDVASVDEIIRSHRIHRVIVAFSRRPESELVEVLRRLALLDVEVHLVPRFFDLGVAPAGPGVDDLWGIPLYHAPRAARHRRSWSLKRLLDVTLASTCLVLSLPVLMILALFVRASGPGGTIFRQRRTGQDGREFHLFKLRSLRKRREAKDPETCANETLEDDVEVQAARRRDVESRSTPIGEFVRRTSLDELPQLWNVVIGDMSLVGPRPEEARFARQFSEIVPGYRHRHRQPVGLTGWAQVNGLRGQTSIAERARFDNHYIEHWSLWRDVVIILRTSGTVLRSIRGRFEGRPRLDPDPDPHPDPDAAWKATR
ncbi:MAG: sugar transferase [Acidimicrobiales bacterium]